MDLPGTTPKMGNIFPKIDFTSKYSKIPVHVHPDDGIHYFYPKKHIFREIQFLKRLLHAEKTEISIPCQRPINTKYAPLDKSLHYVYYFLLLRKTIEWILHQDDTRSDYVKTSRLTKITSPGKLSNKSLSGIFQRNFCWWIKNELDPYPKHNCSVSQLPDNHNKKKSLWINSWRSLLFWRRF